MEFARKMRDDRGKGNIIVVEDGEESEMEADESEVYMKMFVTYSFIHVTLFWCEYV